MVATNGHSPSLRSFPAGVYTPLTTPFKANGEIDYDAWQKQVLRLAKARMGLVVMGTNGEAIHLVDEERAALVRATRQILDSNGFENMPIMAGTGGGSSVHTIKLCKEAKAAGADAAIVIHPGYFTFALGPKNKAAFKDFFLDVLDNSPLPICIYNFPGAASGIDLDSDLLIELSEHPNCMGAKLTCANNGKGGRIAAHTQTKEYLSRHGPFHVWPGFSDYLLPALVVKQTGCITGTGNIIPKTMVKLYDTATAFLKTGDLKLLAEAQELQTLVAEADWCIVKAGIGGTKYALDSLVEKGLGGACRKPLPAADESIKTMVDQGMAKAMAYENSL